MASLISIIIACVLWGIALFLPVLGKGNGLMLILFALFMHIFIIPILFAFPVWANFTFFRTVWFYAQSNMPANQDLKRKNELQEKAKEWANITFIFMFWGMCSFLFTTKGQVQIGAIVWFLSGVFLLFGIYIRGVPEKYAVLSLSALLISTCSSGVWLYQHEAENEKYQDGWFQTFDLKSKVFFSGRESDLVIPPLVRVKLNDLAWAEKGIKSDPKEVDLSFSNSDQIELQFQSVIPQIIDREKKPVCKLKQGQQFELARPIQYIEHDIAWKNYHDFAIGIPNKEQSDYIYRMNYIDNRHAQIEIIRKKDNKNVYTQNLITYAKYDRCHYGPVGYKGELDTAFKSAYLATGLKHDGLKVDGKFAEKEVLHTCSWESRPERVYAFEDKFLKILDLRMVKPQLLCSEHYIAVVNLSKDDNGEHLDDYLKVQFLHRDTFQPIDCGWLLFHLEKTDIQKLFNDELTVQSLDILDTKNSNKCPDIQIELSNGLKNVEHNYLADYY